MGLNLNLAKVAVSVMVQIPEQVFERHVPSSPRVVGQALAEAVMACERAQGLGYYPALDFFQEQGGVEPELLNAAENIAWLGTSLVREEVAIRLRSVFSSVTFQSVYCPAFTMPTVRPGQPDAVNRLARHFTPDRVKLDLRLTSFRKQANEEGFDRLAEHMLYRWLKDSFEEIRVTSVRSL